MPASHISASAEELYCDHGRWLQQWLRKRLGDAADAADVTHDTFLRVLVREPVTVHEPRAYLITIAKGLLANLLRGPNIEHAYLRTLRDVPDPSQPSPEERAILIEMLTEIDRRLDGLPAAVRRAFLLSQLDGMSQKEIAQQLHVSIPTVQRYIVKALHQCCFATRIQK